MSYIQSLNDIYFRTSSENLFAAFMLLLCLLLFIIAYAQTKEIPLHFVWEKILLSVVIIIISRILSWTGLMPYIGYPYFIILIFPTAAIFLKQLSRMPYRDIESSSKSCLWHRFFRNGSRGFLSC